MRRRFVIALLVGIVESLVDIGPQHAFGGGVGSIVGRQRAAEIGRQRFRHRVRRRARRQCGEFVLPPREFGAADGRIARFLDRFLELAAQREARGQ